LLNNDLIGHFELRLPPIQESFVDLERSCLGKSGVSTNPVLGIIWLLLSVLTVNVMVMGKMVISPASSCRKLPNFSFWNFQNPKILIVKSTLNMLDSALLEAVKIIACKF
jgi:hypothetical protein